MGHVQVPADHYRLLFPEPVEVLPQLVLKDHAEGQALKAPLGVGGVYCHQVEALILQGDSPALPVVVLTADSVGDAYGLGLSEDSRAGVAFFLSGVPVFKIAGELEICLLPEHFCLLQADGVGLLPVYHIHETLAHTGPKAVYVP